MRTLVRVTMPVEAGNAAVRDGRLPQLISSNLEKLKPEAAYFFTDHGQRTAMLVIDLKDVSDIPAIAEPFFMEVNASVEFFPVMNAEDLKKGLQQTSARV